MNPTIAAPAQSVSPDTTPSITCNSNPRPIVLAHAGCFLRDPLHNQPVTAIRDLCTYPRHGRDDELHQFNLGGLGRFFQIEQLQP